MDYDAEYRSLRAQGHQGWAAGHYERGLDRMQAELDRLVRDGHLPKPPACMLELGCGNGMSSFLLAQKGYDAHGIDISDHAITWARERFVAAGLSGSFHVGDVRSMPCFAKDFFDIVFDGSCFHCLIGDDRGRCLRELGRILHEVGVLVMSTMCGSPRSEEACNRFDPQTHCLLRDGRPYRTLKPVDAIREEILCAGFRIDDVTIHVNPWWDHATIVCRHNASTGRSFYQPNG